ncbi:probable proline--tRNA ligase, mitochondrial [Thrips palmi]|uniref:Probable proline--tRNA ligase, mitochondrial n=1 Tax=Thrips palmi TaxID=161013 RepID=A0A6P8ZB42_THRPL|nr:probable proline--tRNA ligase, mitochondrial [Thrips palmi]
MNRVTRLFQPTAPIPKSLQNSQLIKSQRMMLEQGVIRATSTGLYTLLPLGMRALKKLENIVDRYMEKVGAQKILLPTLTSDQLWEQSGRLEEAKAGSELFLLEDRHKKRYILGPTHEEAITELLAAGTRLSYRRLPLLLYQISNKYRDEPRPRFGLLRTREFVMKDLYSFDANAENALKTYESVTEAYNGIFQELGVKYVRVEGDSGMMGGSMSHEFHYPCEAGEERIIQCNACNVPTNASLLQIQSDSCPHCQSTDISTMAGIEVGHTFILGTRYSKPMNATFIADDKSMQSLIMGCYGLGLSRILAASLEALSLPTELRWPLCIAPYKACIITPKHGSKEEAASVLTQGLYDSIECNSFFKNDVIVDDRTNLSIGRRITEAKRSGYPLIIVIGKKAVEDIPRFEVIDLVNNREYEWTDGSLASRLKEYCPQI